MFIAVVLHVAEKRFLADAVIMDNMVQLRRKETAENKGKPRAENIGGRGGKEVEEAEEFWSMLYADDAGIVPR